MTITATAATAAATVVMWISASEPPPDLLIPIDTAIMSSPDTTSAGTDRPPDTTQPVDSDVPPDTALPVGGEAPLATAVTGALEGQQCDVQAIRRPDATEIIVGNDLIVESGEARVVLSDVERELEATTDGGPLTLGPTVSVALVMGPDQRFAAGLDVEFVCGEVSEPAAPTIPTSNPADQDGSSSDESSTGTVVAAVLIGAVIALGAGAVIAMRRRRGNAGTPR